ARKVARDGEEPGPQRRTLAPACPVAMEPEKRLHHQVVRRRRVVEHPCQVAAERVLPAPEERLERRRVPRAIVREQRLVARLGRDRHPSRPLYPGTRPEVQSHTEPDACLAGTTGGKEDAAMFPIFEPVML